MSKKQREKVEDEVRFHRAQMRAQSDAAPDSSVYDTQTPSSSDQLQHNNYNRCSIEKYYAILHSSLRYTYLLVYPSFFLAFCLLYLSSFFYPFCLPRLCHTATAAGTPTTRSATAVPTATRHRWRPSRPCNMISRPTMWTAPHTSRAVQWSIPNLLVMVSAHSDPQCIHLLIFIL